jgi:DNA-binding NarL/FixJ family response regulator
MIRVLICDDHPLMRRGVRDMLAGDPGIEVVGEASSGHGAEELAAAVDADVMVLDLTMPYDDHAPVTRSAATGLDAIAAIRRLADAPAVVVLSVHGEPSMVRAALRGGATGYVLKESVSSDLGHAIHAVAAGGLFLSSEVAAVLNPANDGDSTEEPSLSPREREVVQLVVDGLSTKQIAARLQTSPKTVEKQRRNAMRKLDVPNVAALVRAVTAEGR